MAIIMMTSSRQLMEFDTLLSTDLLNHLRNLWNDLAGETDARYNQLLKVWNCFTNATSVFHWLSFQTYPLVDLIILYQLRGQNPSISYSRIPPQWWLRPHLNGQLCAWQRLSTSQYFHKLPDTHASHYRHIKLLTICSICQVGINSIAVVSTGLAMTRSLPRLVIKLDFFQLVWLQSAKPAQHLDFLLHLGFLIILTIHPVPIPWTSGNERSANRGINHGL